MNTVKNIKWSIEFDDVLEMILESPVEKAAKILEIPTQVYANMHDREISDYVYDWYKKGGYDEIVDILELPTEVEVPEDIMEDEIADYLTDTYDFCVEDFDMGDALDIDR